MVPVFVFIKNCFEKGLKGLRGLRGNKGNVVSLANKNTLWLYKVAN